MIKTAIFGLIREGKPNIDLNYFEHIRQSGSEAVAIYPENPEQAAQKYDCLVVCGDNDIHPGIYGQKPFYCDGTYDINFDMYENRLIKLFVKYKKPILGIGRGMQSINVALGGTLIQDIPEVLNLYHKENNNPEYSHEIKISKESELSKVMGIRAIVGSKHHQCVHLLGQGLKVIAASHDGIIEAFEGYELPIIGIQWHPEKMSGNDIFDYFYSKYC